jgi:poly-gamma-glutamate biosynthesis protein PgsC/CapC
MELLAVAIGIGLVVGLLCSELFGIAAAGLVVPGYMALFLTKPLPLVATLLVAFVAFGVVRLVSSFLIVHGRRRTALMILVGYVLGMLASRWTGPWFGSEEIQTIGYIIPGLIAVWMDRQSIAQTLSSLFVVSVAVRLVLILTMDPEALP